MRLAWFSPMPPVRSGVAACSADLVARLADEHLIEVYVDAGSTEAARQCAQPGVRSAHDFVWRHRREPYDLVVYQVGNSSHHDYIWPYLFRYPGLAVLHDAHLHHARAAALLRTRRTRDYRAEFAAAHPDVPPDAAELAVAGFDNYLYYEWPMTRLVAMRSRMTAAHTPAAAAMIREQAPSARVESIRLGHGTLVTADEAASARASVRLALGIPDEAVLFGVFGGLAPEKRIPQVLDALGHVRAYAHDAHLLLAGAAAAHYDVVADVRARGLETSVTLTGYLDDEAGLTRHLAACDVSLNLRWPTAREVSGPWLRALGAGRATIVLDLAHLTGVPSLDPRTWTVNAVVGADAGPPVTVAIDIADEDHSLRLAMRRLALDPALRGRLGAEGQRYWLAEHSLDAMVDDYRRLLPSAASLPPSDAALPDHLVDDGRAQLRALVDRSGLDRAAIAERGLAPLLE